MTAAFCAMLVAPAVHRRIVTYTERRLTATMPLSPQEVRAQKDMARAGYAAENARTAEELRREREKSLSLTVARDELARDAGQLAAELSEAQTQIEAMNTEAADLRSELRRSDSNLEQLRLKLKTAEGEIAGREARIETLTREIAVLAANLDNLKVDLATRDTEIESFRYRMSTLREEREGLRHDVKLLTQRAKEAENRLQQEEHRVMRLEDQLARERARAADREALIERRTADVERLRERLRQSGRGVARNRFSGPAGDAAVAPSLTDIEDLADMTETETRRLSETDVPALEQAVRGRAARLADEVAAAGTPDGDAALREEIAGIGATMVALTATREGAASPIRPILAQAPPRGDGPVSLAERVLDMLPEPRSDRRSN